MPRVSHKQRVLQSLQEEIEKYNKYIEIQEALRDDLSSSSENTSSSGDTTDVIKTYVEDLQQQYNAISQQRYLADRSTHRIGFSEEVFNRHFRSEPDSFGRQPWLNDEEFKKEYRMSRNAFWSIVNMIKDHDVFHSLNSKKKQAPVERQLAIFLYYLGSSGSGASSYRIRNLYGIGKGTADLWKERCCKALRSFKRQYISWPNAEERSLIASRIYSNYSIPNCIAIADGTLFPLMQAPFTKDAPAYHGRKHLYSLSVMIVNDDKKKIRYYLSGFPGSAHDQRVFSNTDLYKQPSAFFSDEQNLQNYYLIGDSAFSNSPTVVAAFKGYNNILLNEEQEKFNTVMGSLRVTSEHTIGILKNRFQFLKCIPMKITEKKSSLKRVLRYVECCIILHNFLAGFESDDENNEWHDENDDVSDIDASLAVLDINNEVSEQDSHDARRQIVYHFLKEYTVINR